MKQVKTICILSILAFLAAARIAAQPPDTTKWVSKAPLPTPRGLTTAAVIGDHIYVTGGAFNIFTSTPVMEVYDFSSDTWDTTRASLPVPVCAAASAVVGGKIYVIGGKSTYAGTSDFLSSVYVYDPENDAAGWSKLPGSMPTPRAFHSACVAGDTAIFVIGGRQSATTSLATVEKFVPSPDGGHWTTVESLHQGRSNFACGWLPDGKIYVLAGYWENCAQLAETMEVYDPETDNWVIKEAVPGVKRSHPGYGIYGDSIYLFGGLINSTTPLYSLFKYTPDEGFYGMGPELYPDTMVASASGVVSGHLFSIGSVLYPFIAGGPGETVSGKNLIIDMNSLITVAAIEKDALPAPVVLFQNQPNPFSAQTAITYEMAHAAHICLQVFDLNGQIVATLVNGRQGAGEHTVTWDAGGMPPGIYFYRMQTEDGVLTRKCILK